MINYRQSKTGRALQGLMLVLVLLIPLNLFAQQLSKKSVPLSRILFVFDASQSMAGYWESDVKINIARNYLIRMIDSLQYHENVEMALRVYGHQSPVPPQDCSDTKLEVPFGKNNASRIRQKLNFIEPKGTTPIAGSLLACMNDFPPCDANCRNIVILITDGMEACDGDPCQASTELQKQGIILKPFIIGIGIDEGFKETFNCIGYFYNAPRENNFEEMLSIVITQALNSTTAQVNLLDQEGNPTETNVNMTFFDHFSGKIKHNYIHTINNKGNPDTLILDPMVTYDLTVHTIPPVSVDSIKVYAGKHTIIAADAPQGFLLVKSKDGIDFRGMELIVRKAGDMKTLNSQKINTTEKYITGKYDLEIPTLPRLLLYNVDIKQSSTTTVELPRPGIVTFLMITPGVGSVFSRKGDALERIYNLQPDARSESLFLLPGKYTVVYRAVNAKQSIYTISKNFEVNEGTSLAVELY